MEEIIERSIRNSDLTVLKERRSFLTYPKNGLASCTLSETEDSITLSFETEGLENAESVFKMPLENQLRFLINGADLSELCLEYEFSLSPDNLMVDINMRPLLLERDAVQSGESNFLAKYKALIGAVLFRRYKYEDFLRGGNDLFKKNKRVAELVAHTTVDEIKSNLTQEYNLLKEDTQNNKRTVSKRNVIISRIAIPLLIVITLASTYFTWDALLRQIPQKDGIIAANTAYISEDYLGVQQALDGFALSALPIETKFILSRSYASTEALADDQKEHVLTGLTRRTDTIIFDYWILLGRMDFTAAIDIAQRLSEDELLLFAYLKYEAFVRNDASLSGEEKVTILSNLENEITRIIESRAESSSSPTVVTMQ